MSDEERESRGRRLVALAALLVWLAVTLPLALGTETLFLRDVFTIHLHFKAWGAQELAAGRIPAIHPGWGMGQPFRGNPNTLAFYPGNLVYLLLPFWIAFQLHYLLHWLLAFFTFRALARALGLGATPALFAALTWAGSGWMLTNLTFYNLLTVAAWWPLALLGAVRGGSRGVALGGLGCGLALLGGEPVTATLGLLPLVWLAVERHGLRRGGLTAVAIGVLGLGVALPQVVATARVIGFTWRGVHGVQTLEAGYALHPLRLLELLLPLPFGRPEGLGPEGFWAGRVGSRVPFVLSLHVGVVALALAVLGAVRRPRWGIPAALGVALAWGGAVVPELLTRLSLGLFRYPEKFVLWFALFVPLLAGVGLEALGRRTRRTSSTTSQGVLLAAGFAGVALALATVAALAGPALVGWLAPGLSAEEVASVARVQMPRWIGGLLLSGLLLGATAWVVGRRPPERRLLPLLLLQLLALLPLLRLIPRDATAFYRRPAPWLELVREQTAVDAEAGGKTAPAPSFVPATYDSPFDPTSERPVYYLPQGATKAAFLRLGHLDLDFPTGVAAGLAYPLAPDLEGFHSPHLHVLLRELPRMDPATTGHWLRALGVEALSVVGDPPAPGLHRIAEAVHGGVPTGLYRVEGTAPAAWWPERVEAVATAEQAFRAVSRGPDSLGRVTVPGGFEGLATRHQPGGRVRGVEDTPDRLVLEVDGPGGLVVVRRAYRPIYRARSGARDLAVLPANLLLVGIEVPAGRHRVVLEVSAWPEAVAGVAALVLALGLAWIAVRGSRSISPRDDEGQAPGDDASGLQLQRTDDDRSAVAQMGTALGHFHRAGEIGGPDQEVTAERQALGLPLRGGGVLSFSVLRDQDLRHRPQRRPGHRPSLRRQPPGPGPVLLDPLRLRFPGPSGRGVEKEHEVRLRLTFGAAGRTLRPAPHEHSADHQQHGGRGLQQRSDPAGMRRRQPSSPAELLHQPFLQRGRGLFLAREIAEDLALRRGPLFLVRVVTHVARLLGRPGSKSRRRARRAWWSWLFEVPASTPRSRAVSSWV